MADVILQVIPGFYKNYSKNSLFISANTYEKCILRREHSISRHDDKMCFLPICRYHFLVIGNIKELRQKLDAFCFNYQHVDCLYTLFKYSFCAKIVVKIGKPLDIVMENRGVDRMPSIAKKRLLRKRPKKKRLLGSFPKTESTQFIGSVIADRIEQFKTNKFELEPIKNVDCLLPGHGNYTSHLVSFKMNSW